MAHTCSTALVRCIDFRLEPAISEWLIDKGLAGDCDVIAVAGASKDVAEDPNGFAAGQVALSHKLHETGTVVLMHHTDCGAYGGRDAFDGEAEERAKHLEDMKEARAAILEIAPSLNVRLMLAVIDEDGEVEIEEAE